MFCVFWKYVLIRSIAILHNRTWWITLKYGTYFIRLLHIFLKWVSDDLCRACRVLHFFSVPAMTACARLHSTSLIVFVCFFLFVFVCSYVCFGGGGLWRLVPATSSVVFSTYVSLCQAAETCAWYAECYISTYASCVGCTKFCFSTYVNCARLWQPVPGVLIVIFLPMPAVTTCAGYAVLSFYLWQLWRPVPSTKRFIFLNMPAVPGAVCCCAGFVECYHSTYTRLWRPVPGMWIVIFLPMPAVTTCAGGYRLYICLCKLRLLPGGLSYFYLCQLWRPVPGM